MNLFNNTMNDLNWFKALSSFIPATKTRRKRRRLKVVPSNRVIAASSGTEHIKYESYFERDRRLKLTPGTTRIAVRNRKLIGYSWKGIAVVRRAV